ncbi:MAG: RNA polymerase sigma factor [Ferruginibacter sp.]
MPDGSLYIEQDEELINSLRQNSSAKRKAEEQLFTKYMYFIREGMHRYSLTEEEAFDAYSDCILQAINNIVTGIFAQQASIKTYLYRIFNNKCVDLIRKKTTNKQGIHQTAEISHWMEMISDAAKTVVQQLMDKTDIEILKIKLNQLADNCRQMLSMFAEGLSDKEIAYAMEYKSADVVKTSRLRCLDKLKQLYKY